MLARTPALSRDLRGALDETRKLVDQPSTKTTLQRLTHDLRLGQAAVAVRGSRPDGLQLLELLVHLLAERPLRQDQVGYSFRQALVNAPFGDQTVIPPPPLDVSGPVTLPGQAETPVAGYSGEQANGIAGSARRRTPGMFKPHDAADRPRQPVRALRPGRQRLPARPDRLHPRQTCESRASRESNPRVAVSDIPGSRGPTTLYWKRDGTRELRDTRIASHQPSGKIVNP